MHISGPQCNNISVALKHITRNNKAKIMPKTLHSKLIQNVFLGDMITAINKEDYQNHCCPKSRLKLRNEEPIYFQISRFSLTISGLFHFP